MKALFPSVLLSLLCSAALAKVPVKKTQPVPTTDLLEQARREANTQGVKSQSATDAGVSNSGVLRLDDPGLRPDDSPWKWMLGLRVQRFQPQGRSQMSNGQDFRLDSVSATPFPFLELGLRRQVHETNDLKWNGTLRLEGGYNSSKTDVTFITGAKAANSQLTTNMLGATLVGGLSFKRFSALELELGYGQGLLNYTQSADNNAASFTDEGRYQAWTVGAIYWLNQDWGVGLEQTRRSLSATNGNNIDLQADNASINTRVMW